MELQAVDDLLAEARARRALPEPSLRRLLRERLGLSQQQIADVLGITRPAVSRYESGRRHPRGQTLLDYGALLQRLAAETTLGFEKDEDPANGPGLVASSAGQGRYGKE